ncbi:MAG: site-specific DNA-methyltransferase [Saprospiraceae bacterium]|nr:site-specific DNA-methyltransferase [Saprospiraceae bacterium]MCF8250155.1 site-specific DNA-methyltransferase [Saprospiraceae bacterium]MCF8279418.1 site-specific DNA-methyltransferase [Bacteroidales bacterium]MCF8311209.1 site-specific DNA-methyltransferase [Saprospiraceae bacterium]MCF8440411.1 site-specific DNA-methyltransferase [Saprospiraceae bacterium]
MAKSREGTSTSSFGTSGRVNHDASKFYNSRLYTELNGGKMPDDVANTFPQSLENQVFTSSSESMSEIPSGSVHLMITSPPYNANKDYDEDLSLQEYLDFLKNVFTETYRVLVPGGRACINLANLGRKPYIPLTSHIALLMQEIGFIMRGEIIWDKGASSTSSTAWGSWQSASNPILRDVHEYILIFSKGDYKRHLTKKEKEEKKSTISRDEFLDWTKTIWQMNAESARRVGHPAPFPLELPNRLIQLYSFETDVVLDPFMGSGTTAMAALRSGRKFVGYEIVEEYVELARKRIAAAKKLG